MPTLMAVAATAALALAPSAMAAAPTTVELDSGGATTLKLSKKVAKALKAAGIKTKTSKGANSGKKGFNFPITGGEVDPVDLNPADIDHRGTLTFKLGKHKVALKSPNMVLGGKSKLSFSFGGRTVAFFSLSLGGIEITREGFESTDASGIAAKLTKAGAKALNKGLDVKSFKKGAKVGTVSTDTREAEALIDGAAGTKSKLTLNLGTAAAFQSQNVSATAIAPATQTNPITFEFPVTGGTLEVASLQGAGPLQGQVQHSGGILLTDSDNGASLPLTELFDELDSTPAVSVLFGAGRVEAADLDLSGATKNVTGNQVTFNGAVVKVNAAASAVIQQSFGLAVPPGTVFGVEDTTLTLL